MKEFQQIMLIIALSCFFTDLSSQSIIRQSINCFGKSNVIDGGIISETVGQVYFTGSFIDNGTWLNPGFQQRRTAYIRDKESLDELQIKVYPNPVSDNLYLISADEIKDARIEIVDITGKTIILSEQDIFSNSVINLEHCTEGLYTLRITDETTGKTYHSLIIIK